MEVFGNVEYIKKAIQKKYDELNKELDREIEERCEEVKAAFSKEIASLKEHFELRLENLSRQQYMKILNEEKSRAKRAYEEQREKMIGLVFEEVMKEAQKKAHTKEYINFVKVSLKGEETGSLHAVGDSDFYRKEFPKLKVEKGFAGMKFRSGDTIIDLTIDGALKSKKDSLRQLISHRLFGDV